MRRFTSYGPVNPNTNYYTPRKDLISRALNQLMGDNPLEDGHYITVWAPRQSGKTWVMQQILFELKKNTRFDALMINLENLKNETDEIKIMNFISKRITEELGKNATEITSYLEFSNIFKKDVLSKPLILILDEFDALGESAINIIVSGFRSIYNNRRIEGDKTSEEKTYLLHALSLIGVRSVLGIENVKGSPFNVQRSLHVPNLTFEEIKEMFLWYEKESGQAVEPQVIEYLYRETNGQPGLIGWFGELLTEGFEGYTIDKSRPINMTDLEAALGAATQILPNNTILNMISKAKVEPYKQLLFELFKTDRKLAFRFDDPEINYLYMNGIISFEIESISQYYMKFSSPFVQKRLFNYFSNEIFKQMGQLVHPFENTDDIFPGDGLNIKNLVRIYQKYLQENRSWLFKDVPRRSDFRIYEAIFHFNTYKYLSEFLNNKGGKIIPEFPTGNGKIDLIIKYKNNTYGIELKSFSGISNYRDSLSQAAHYGKKLNLSEIYLFLFVEEVENDARLKYETEFKDETTGVTVIPLFIETNRKG